MLGRWLRLDKTNQLAIYFFIGKACLHWIIYLESDVFYKNWERRANYLVCNYPKVYYIVPCCTMLYFSMLIHLFPIQTLLYFILVFGTVQKKKYEKRKDRGKGLNVNRMYGQLITQSLYEIISSMMNFTLSFLSLSPHLSFTFTLIRLLFLILYSFQVDLPFKVLFFFKTACFHQERMHKFSFIYFRSSFE
ncbi:predicted protein [Lodderomyces elongisporus NRRL YB-4239]|uniref:Uncharacterized protein n=1 Tax=Lodderomyces elongisporus (strain ATCC 11503 / CBS 2605 / JCM 1781 / NBRC 1676 / NRRL YB-4239) TaxID=379508 RepID=A5E7I5_LODEL|nr:predicted protein [Lodderomyces elongisporus NRRL YB-4239]